jgi:hypothetical protein
VYLLIGLLDDARARQDKDEAAAKFELEQKAKNRDLAREIKRQKAMAQPARTAATERQDSGNLPGDWRQLTEAQRHHLAHLPREERAAMLPDAPRTRRLWNERLDKIAAQNGNYMKEV